MRSGARPHFVLLKMSRSGKGELTALSSNAAASPSVATMSSSGKTEITALFSNASASPSAAKAVRGAGFSQPEVEVLLNVLENELPLCQEEWQVVFEKHRKSFPKANRTLDSLKRKFNALARVKMPTGDPNMPADVKKAKRIRFLMTERSEIGDGEEDIDVLPESTSVRLMHSCLTELIVPVPFADKHWYEFSL